MNNSAEQLLFDWNLDGTMYSGENKRLTQVADEYKEELSARADLINRREVDKDTGHQLHKLNESTVPVVADDILSNVSNIRERYSHTPVGRARRTTTLTPTHEWEGYVTNILEKSFTVKLIEITDETGQPKDEAEFELKELPKSDQERICLGSVIRWVVGFEKLPNDARQRVSRIHLRRLPVFTKKDGEAALFEAEKLLSGIKW